MVRGFQFEPNRVRPWWQAVENHRLSAGIGPDPRGIVDRHMDVSDAGRHGKRGRSKHRHDVQMFSAILNHHAPTRQGVGQRRIDDDLRRRFVLKRLDCRRPTHVSGGLCSA